MITETRCDVRPIHEFEWSLVDGSDVRHDRRRDLGSERCTASTHFDGL